MPYNTKQQKIISDYLKSCGEHVTAAQVAEYLSQNGYKIGIATVYRHLDKLCAKGEIGKIVTDNEKGAVFCCTCPKTSDTYFHIKCEICGKIEDMDCSYLSKLYAHIKEEHSFNINPKKTLFYGICKQCVK